MIGSVLCGHVNGVQKRIRRVHPKAVYRSNAVLMCLIFALYTPQEFHLIYLDTIQSVSLAYREARAGV